MNPGVNIRLTWQLQKWSHASTLHIHTIQSGANTVISFHQEGLPGAKERENVRHYWQQVLTKLQTFLP